LIRKPGLARPRGRLKLGGLMRSRPGAGSKRMAPGHPLSQRDDSGSRHRFIVVEDVLDRGFQITAAAAS
jgi:hypothetical protein